MLQSGYFYFCPPIKSFCPPFYLYHVRIFATKFYKLTSDFKLKTISNEKTSSIICATDIKCHRRPRHQPGPRNGRSGTDQDYQG